MPKQRKQTPPLLIVPHLDLVIISSRHEKRLRWMKIHTSNRPLVLIKPINKRSHPVVPQLNHPAVQRGQYPWPLGMETESLHSITLCFKFCQLQPYQRHPVRVYQHTGRSSSPSRITAIAIRTLASKNVPYLLIKYYPLFRSTLWEDDTRPQWYSLLSLGFSHHTQPIDPLPFPWLVFLQ